MSGPTFCTFLTYTRPCANTRLVTKTCHSADRAKERVGLDLQPTDLGAIARKVARGKGKRLPIGSHARVLSDECGQPEKWIVEWKGSRLVVLYCTLHRNIVTVLPSDALPLGTNLGSLLSQAR